MTLDELAASLPNGLHDAELAAVALDFTKREAQLSLDIWIGDDEEREAYRRAEIMLSGLAYWVSEPPDPRYPYGEPEALRIDAGPSTKLSESERSKLPPIPVDAFSNYIFVVDWNAFIYLAAQSAVLKWCGERTVRAYGE